MTSESLIHICVHVCVSVCVYKWVSLVAQKVNFPWRKLWQPTPVFLPGESHGQTSLAGYSPRGYKESDMTE